MKRVPKYRLHKTSGRAVVTIACKEFYLGKYGTKESKQAYKRLITEWESTGRSMSFGAEPAMVTVAMLVSDFCDWAQSYYPQNGKDSEAAQILVATAWLSEYSDLPASSFGPLRLKAVRESMIKATGKHGKPLSRGYINDMVGRIVRMFRWGVENEIIESKIHDALKAVPGLRAGRTAAPDLERVLPVQDSVLEATLAYCSPTLAAMIRIQQLCGMRPGEVCLLAPSMIDRSDDVWIAKLLKHKTAWKGKKREIFIGPQAQAILLPFLLRPDDVPLFSPADSEKWRRDLRNAARVTPESCGNQRGSNRQLKPKYQPGNSYDTNSYRKAIWYAVVRAFPLARDASDEMKKEWREMYRWSPNQVRHLTATEIRAKFGLEGAQVYLGHSHADTTQIYAEINREKGKEIARKYG